MTPNIKYGKVIGKGTCGKVCLAQWNFMQVAVKVVETNKPNLVKYIKSEKEIL